MSTEGQRSHGRDLSGEEVAQILGEFVNGASEEGLRAFAQQIVSREHRTLQQLVMGAFMKTMEAWARAHGQGQYDLRNEATVTLARKVVDHVGFAGRMPHI